MPKLPILYGFGHSTCTWRVRAVAAHLKIPYDLKIVNLLENEQDKESFRKINPLGSVPVWVEPDTKRVIAQSMAIAEFLIENNPSSPSLLLDDPYSRAVVRQMCQMIVSDTQPFQQLRLVKEFPTKEDWAKFAKSMVTKGLTALDKLASVHSGTYMFRDEVTLADFCLVPQARKSREMGIDFSMFENLSRIEQACLKLDAIQESDPRSL